MYGYFNREEKICVKFKIYLKVYKNKNKKYIKNDNAIYGTHSSKGVPYTPFLYIFLVHFTHFCGKCHVFFLIELWCVVVKKCIYAFCGYIMHFWHNISHFLVRKWFH